MRNSKPLYIFDLDGTLAIIDHRRHWVEKVRPSANDWRSFHQDCVFDKPNQNVIRTMEALRANGAEIWIFSGRSNEVRNETEQWLIENTRFEREELHTALTMRDQGDFTEDDNLKAKWLSGMLEVDRNRLVAVFDDRDRVVQMWREAGISCFQVAQGKF
ncbi:hypothetical protein H8K35_13875 [Undibacterium sp. LX40W]|uniref:Polynucleotide kinase PNKP phosphatase domain-containing protein n=1 Tax=Undibacterium nitidum TaxID=2762298 RepID=A0A923KUA3_9BURK|nr:MULTISPECIES: hypothetical protein [Undibacterium]MBC3882479.1 hypothetical protein [Undibacterium nitidum]MBC3892760.1 hypothetical protein [Undibacterium sp. LX40W]